MYAYHKLWFIKNSLFGCGAELTDGATKASDDLVVVAAVGAEIVAATAAT